jgi:hypothetical protein
VAADDAWVVGRNANGKAAASHWNGRQWTSQPPVNLDVDSARPFSSHSYLRSVAAGSPDRAWAVGLVYDTDDSTTTRPVDARTLFLTWDGTSWHE